jgi:methylenetetrahydrofolate dehydrogenase (NADP+)/methenyltetrahydrofolate cyclohydrolase/formyltetrahydrofolate synthetase
MPIKSTHPIDISKVTNAICPTKDVDGFQSFNVGELAKNQGAEPCMVPCTPKGCFYLLQQYGIPVEGKHVVVIGRSDIVGGPLSRMALKRNATVTVCHSHTPNLEEFVKQADILFVAVGHPNLVKGEWIKPGPRKAVSTYLCRISGS